MISLYYVFTSKWEEVWGLTKKNWGLCTQKKLWYLKDSKINPIINNSKFNFANISNQTT